MATIHELHTKLVNKEISAVELTNAVISHKAKVEPEVHAYLSDSHELALASAKAVDEAIAKGSNVHDLYEYAYVQINDTHPSMVIPELIRLLTEKHGIGFEKHTLLCKK